MKAVKALQKFAKGAKKETDLLGDDFDFIYVNILLGEVPLMFSPRPQQIAIPNPIYSAKKDTRALLIVKDPVADFKQVIEDMNIPCIAEVMGYETLMKDFGQFKDKRELFNTYDLFFADMRVYRMLPKCLGRKFYEGKKYPYPTKFHKLETSELEEHLNSLTAATYFYQGNGPNYTVKVARTDMKPAQIVENIVKAVPQVVGLVTAKGGIKPEKVQSISIKTATSVDLPFYNSIAKEELVAYLTQDSE